MADVSSYDPKMKNGGYVEKTIISITTVDASVENLGRCLLEKEKRGGHCPKWYGEKYGRSVETAIKQLIGNVRESLKPWS